MDSQTSVTVTRGPGQAALLLLALPSQGHWAWGPTGVATLWESRLSHWLQVQGQEQSQTVPARIIFSSLAARRAVKASFWPFRFLPVLCGGLPKREE